MSRPMPPGWAYIPTPDNAWDHRGRALRKLRRSARREDETFVIVPASWETEGLCAVAPDDPDRELVWDMFDEPLIADVNATATDRAARLSTLRAICERCPVRDKCLTKGMGQTDGFYGGLTPDERLELRRAAARADAAIVAEVQEAAANRAQQQQRDGGVA